MALLIPNSYQTPNVYVDTLLHLLKPQEWMIVSVAMRKTWGWQKGSAPIALTEFCRLSGLSRGAAETACHSLVQFGILTVAAPNGFDNKGISYAVQTDTEGVDIEGLRARRNERKETQKKRTAAALEARGIKPGGTMSDMVGGTMSDMVGGTMSDIAQKTQSKPKYKGEPQAAPAPIPNSDALSHAFERAIAAQSKPAETVIRAWRLSPHLEGIAIVFAASMGVPVSRMDKGKWMKGCQRLNELSPTDDVIRAACARAKQSKDKNGEPMLYTHPGAIVEIVRQLSALQEEAALPPKPLVSVMTDDGYIEYRGAQ